MNNNKHNISDDEQSKIDLVQSISSDLHDTSSFISHKEENDKIARLDETMSKVKNDINYNDNDKNYDSDVCTVFSTKNAKSKKTKTKLKNFELNSHYLDMSSSPSKNSNSHHNYQNESKSNESCDIEEEYLQKNISKGSLMKNNKVMLPPNLLPQSKHKKTKRSQKNKSKKIVGRIRASKALVLQENTSVADAVQLMVDRRFEAALLTNSDGILSGILTDKDVAFKIVAEKKDPAKTLVATVMTRNPSCVSSNTKTMDALQTMVSGHFRHLPVADNGGVIGILDITKCLYEVISRIEKSYDAKSQKFTRAVDRLEKEIVEVTGNIKERLNLFDTMRDKLFMPTLSGLIKSGDIIPKVFETTTALRASEIMLEKNCSAVMVYDDNEQPVGIFTSKDLMRRVLAAEQSPSICLVREAMTRNPDYASLDTTIVDALHLMHDGKFLHLPILGRSGNIVGLTDVLDVTYRVVESMGSLHHSTKSQEKPLWNQFLQSTCFDDESVDSTAASSISLTTSYDDFSTNASSIAPPPQIPDKYPRVFSYKFVDSDDKIHLFQSSAESIDSLKKDIENRLSSSLKVKSLRYIDEEGDPIILLMDSDLTMAVVSAQARGKRSLRLLLPHEAYSRSSYPPSETSSVSSAQLHASSNEKLVHSKSKSYSVVGFAAGAVAAAAAIAGMAITRRN